MAYTTATSRWRAVCTRDPAATSAFVFAVSTTKIYCRPTCPARLARRANVTFFAEAAQAEVSGFRACKRCKPEVKEGVEDAVEKVMCKAKAVIGQWVIDNGCAKDISCAERLTLEVLAAQVGLTKRYLHKVFKERMGVTPKDYLNATIEARMPESRPSTSSLLDLTQGDGSGWNSTASETWESLIEGFENSVLESTIYSCGENSATVGCFGSQATIPYQIQLGERLQVQTVYGIDLERFDSEFIAWDQCTDSNGS